MKQNQLLVLKALANGYQKHYGIGMLQVALDHKLTYSQLLGATMVLTRDGYVSSSVHKGTRDAPRGRRLFSITVAGRHLVEVDPLEEAVLKAIVEAKERFVLVRVIQEIMDYPSRHRIRKTLHRLVMLGDLGVQTLSGRPTKHYHLTKQGNEKVRRIWVTK